jgi:hypothetical protein
MQSSKKTSKDRMKKRMLSMLFDDKDDMIGTVLHGAHAAAQVVAQETAGTKPTPKWGGSKKGKSPNLERDFVGAYNKLISHYFSGTDSLYNEQQFERRFRMKRSIFNRLWDALNGCDPFIQKFDAAKKPGVHPLCRFVACLRILCYGNAADSCDEYLQISESVISNSFKDFCRLIVEKFGFQYLNRPPTRDEIKSLMDKMGRRGMPGCFASWDCKHFDWSSCPVRLQGQHKSGKEKRKTIVLEAIADVDHYIWHIYFGSPGAMNDINILDKSPILGAIHRGDLNIHVDPYFIDNKPADFMYFLVDGIYPDLAYFVKTLNNPINEKEKFFCKIQEGERKAVECAFGELVKKWHILKNPLRYWHLHDIDLLVKTCVILHNMIVEERRDMQNMNVSEGDQLFHRLALEAETNEATTQGMPGHAINEPESGYNMDSFCFLGQLEQKFQSSMNSAGTREEISLAISERIHSFIQITENPHRSHGIRMALVEHVWKKKKNRFMTQNSVVV